MFKAKEIQDRRELYKLISFEVNCSTGRPRSDTCSETPKTPPIPTVAGVPAPDDLPDRSDIASTGPPQYQKLKVWGPGRTEVGNDLGELNSFN